MQVASSSERIGEAGESEVDEEIRGCLFERLVNLFQAWSISRVVGLTDSRGYCLDHSGSVQLAATGEVRRPGSVVVSAVPIPFLCPS